MNRDFENINYTESERLAMLESKAAELERMLGRVAPGLATGFAAGLADGLADQDTAQYPTIAFGATGYRDPDTGCLDATPFYPGYEAGGYEADEEEGTDERTEVLINRGRRNAPPPRRARWFGRWRAIAVVAAGVTVGAFGISAILPGATPAWPASVARVKAQITVACQNPNVVSEPTQVNFACAKATRQVLWVFSLLTSGDNPDFSDQSNGRKGLEPITPAQGGDLAWSLNLHHPYNPLNPTDSLEVAARAINNIIGGATLTGSSGSPVVQPGLESDPANCARYTGSSALVTRQGFPPICALQITTPDGQAALVADVFKQWMVGTPARIAAEAGVLFANADNPGDARVQAIVKSLPVSKALPVSGL